MQNKAFSIDIGSRIVYHFKVLTRIINIFLVTLKY